MADRARTRLGAHQLGLPINPVTRHLHPNEPEGGCECLRMPY